MSTFSPFPGALRTPDPDGGWVCANPCDQLFSLLTFTATEFWDGEKWVGIQYAGDLYGD